MQWNSMSEFLAMGGYAFYVWGSVGACALGMVLEVWMLKHRRRAILARLPRKELA
jgi:heme exporter protein D